MSFEPSICTVVLAGGRGTRMGGQDKGLVQYKGRPLIEYCLDAVSQQSERVVISCNRNIEAYREYSEFVVSDQDGTFKGPLAGLLAARTFCEQDWVFCCPCDMPHLSAKIVTSLINGFDATVHDITVCHDGLRRQNLLMLFKASCLDSIAAYLEQGGRRVDGWQNQWRTVERDCSEWAADFLNVNTVDELDL